MSPQLDRRTFLAGVLGVAGGVALGACSGGSKGPTGQPANGTLRLSGGPLGFLSPFAYASGLGYYQMSMLYDTLLWRDSTGQLLPWLAASQPQRSADNLTYTFALRPNVTWSDGTPFTADDVVFTFDYFASNTLSPLVTAQPHGVTKVVATGPQTVEIHLSAPDVTFLAFVAGAVPIVPRHVWEPIKDPASARDTKILVGTGAYKLQSYGGEGKPVSFTARPDYFLGKPFLNRLELIPVDDDLAALNSNVLDAGGNFGSLGGTRPSVLAPFRTDPAFDIIDQKAGQAYSLYFNLGRGGALADPRFRHACARGVDRRNILTRVTGNDGQIGNPGFLPPGHPFHVDVEQYPYDLAAAGAMLDAAGYRASGGGARTGPDGKPLAFDLIFDSNAAAAGQLVYADLKKLGLQITPRALPLGAQLFGAKSSGDFGLALLPYPGPAGVPPYGDPDVLRQVYSAKLPPGETNAAGYNNPQFEQLAQQQLATFDDAKRRPLIAQMQQIVAADLPVLPVYYSTSYYIFRKAAFDQWYWTPGGFPVGVVNKQGFITGQKTGTAVRART